MRASVSRSVVLVPLFVSAVVVTPLQAFAQVDPGGTTLYERLGGLPAISLVVSDFVDVFVEDPIIMANAAVRERKTDDTAPYIKYQVTTLICEVTDGPCSYTGLDLRQAHAGLNVSAQEWDRMVEIFVATLDAHRVPATEKDELLGILGPTRSDIVADDP